MSNLLTAKQVAAELNITDGYVRQLLISGELRGQKIGGRWLVEKKDFEDFRSGYEKFARREIE